MPLGRLALITTFIFMLHSCVVLSVPLTFFEAVSRFYRQGNKYDEDHPRDTPIESLFREYDFIIVGAGTAGCVVANRLSEVGHWKVLLLEAGKDEIFFTDIPIFVAYFQMTNYNWGYRAQPQTNACLGMNDRRCTWPRGKALGGTSTINYMIYTRCNSKDFDRWAELGNTGWSYKEVLPYFLKSENIEIPELKKSPFHATGGNLNVGYIPFKTPLSQAFVEAGQELGYSVTDYNGETQDGFSHIQVTQRNGSRLSTSKAFLRPVRDRPNLHILQRAHVTRVLIDPLKKQAIGVEFVKDGQVIQVKARKEVILSAGTLNTPQILMISGIGPRVHLQELGIPIVNDLPVGENLQEHPSFVGLTFLVNDTVGLIESRLTTVTPMIQYFCHGQGPLTVPGGAEAIAYVRTKYAVEDKPDMELLFVGGAINSDAGGPIRKGMGISDAMYNSVYRSIDNKDSWTIFPLVMSPKSKGVIRLKDKNPFHWPLFYANLLDDPRDLDVLVEGIKMAVELSKTHAFQKFGSRLHDVPFPGCTMFLFASDEYWRCAARYLTGTLHHQVGTCKMGPPDDPTAVVDPELRVNGIKGLRVIDASIIPVLPSCHTNAVAIMIGEKGSDLIKEFWRRND